MCTGHCNTFILWLGQQSLETYIPVILHKNTLIATRLEGLWSARTKDTCTHSGSAVVFSFFRDTLNNQCCLQRNPYSPYPCLQDIKHQLLCQILFRSQEWQVGHTNEAWIHTHTRICMHTHTPRVMHKLYPKHTSSHIHLPPSSFCPWHTQIHIQPQKQSFFERESGGWEGGGAQLAS